MDAAAPLPSRILLLTGATASGKSEVAQLLAEDLNGEIISVDSMQVYRGLDIGTAKPSARERGSVPYHLIDVAGLNENFDAARFARMTRAAIAEIHARNRLPILCGGTGLYFRAFLEGLGESPPANAALRAELASIPMQTLLEELKQRDPVSYEKIDRHNPRRVIRAIEVIRLTNKPFSSQQAPWPAPVAESWRGPAVFFGLLRAPEDLRERMNARVDAMFQRGLVEETARMLTLGLAENITAMQAIGYRQVVEHLRGERPLAETIELVKIRTRQFAKRQMTWFRRQAKVTWIEVARNTAAKDVAAEIRARFERSMDPDAGRVSEM